MSVRNYGRIMCQGGDHSKEVFFDMAVFVEECSWPVASFVEDFSSSALPLFCWLYSLFKSSWTCPVRLLYQSWIQGHHQCWRPKKSSLVCMGGLTWRWQSMAIRMWAFSSPFWSTKRWVHLSSWNTLFHWLPGDPHTHNIHLLAASWLRLDDLQVGVLSESLVLHAALQCTCEVSSRLSFQEGQDCAWGLWVLLFLPALLFGTKLEDMLRH